MRRRAFWPGFEWGVLAHRRAKVGAAKIEDYIARFEVDSTDFEDPIEFDELVIDDWFHLEQMSDRRWWIGLGTAEDGVGYEWMINVHVDRNGRATVSMERYG